MSGLEHKLLVVTASKLLRELIGLATRGHPRMIAKLTSPLAKSLIHRELQVLQPTKDLPIATADCRILIVIGPGSSCQGLWCLLSHCSALAEVSLLRILPVPLRCTVTSSLRSSVSAEAFRELLGILTWKFGKGK